MQVSWIDADRIKALVAQIAPLETCTEETPGLLELDTAPESWGFAMDKEEPFMRPVSAAPEFTAAIPAEPEPQEELKDERDHGSHDQPLHNPAAALPLSRIRDKLRAIRQRATDAGILTRVNEAGPMEPVSDIRSAESAPVDKEGSNSLMSDASVKDASVKMEPALPVGLKSSPPFEIPPGSRDVRLAAFAGWARKVLHEDGGHVLVMSDDGEVLWGGEAKAGLVLSTMMAWGAAIRASAMSACETPPVIHQTLASGNVLTVIPCETASGMVHAAVAAPAGLTHEQAHVLREALCAAMN